MKKFLPLLLLLVACQLTYELSTEMPFYYNVSPTPSFGLNMTGVYFGAAPPYSHLEKKITLTNDFDNSRRFHIAVVGNSSGVIFVHPSNVWTIPPGESQEFTVKLIPGDVPYGRYYGSLRIYQKPSKAENRAEWMEVLPPFEFESMWSLVNVVNQCHENNPIVSSDLGFTSMSYFRSVKRC